MGAFTVEIRQLPDGSFLSRGQGAVEPWTTWTHATHDAEQWHASVHGLVSGHLARSIRHSTDDLSEIDYEIPTARIEQMPPDDMPASQVLARITTMVLERWKPDMQGRRKLVATRLPPEPQLRKEFSQSLWLPGITRDNGTGAQHLLMPALPEWHATDPAHMPPMAASLALTAFFEHLGNGSLLRERIGWGGQG